MTEINQPKSWREQIPVHPAADMFPMMTPDELKALGEDIKENGLQMNIVVWRASDGRPWQLVDGRNRLDAAELVGLPVKFIKEDGHFLSARIGDYDNAVDDVTSMNPYEVVISANVHRRHLTPEQKRDLIAAVLKAQPEKSNRTIARQTKADHKTVGTVRERLEAGGEIPHDVHEDARGTRQPAQKPQAKPAAKTSATPAPAPQQAEPQIDPATLSLSAQEKLAAAIRQATRKLELEVDKRAQQRLREVLETVLPAYRESAAIAENIIKSRKGLMTKATYNKIASCLHPDSRNSVTDEKLNDVFQIWRGLEIRLLDESQHPAATSIKVPRTYEELMALKQKVSAARRAKREAKREANLAHRQ